MKDLRSQLAAQFGRPDPPRDDSSIDGASNAGVAAASTPSILDPDAHLGDPWLNELRAVCSGPAFPTVPQRPSLPAARQLTDKALKTLKGRGDRRTMKALKDLRARFLSRRDKAAWSEIKGRFADWNLSEKAYRSLKQQKRIEPIRVLARMDSQGADALKGLGADRLRDALLEK